jgi:hypothetical protein
VQLNLKPHPAAPPADPPFDLWATVDYAGAFGATGTLNIWFGIGTPASRFVIPEGSGDRRDELWKTTCFEAFLNPEGETAYEEWNFAPSGDWAAYQFDAPRQGMREAEVGSPPYIRMEDNLTWWALGATIAIPTDAHWRLGLSAVIEEKDGTKSYWALTHCGDRPDFHDPGCFTARLA